VKVFDNHFGAKNENVFRLTNFLSYIQFLKKQPLPSVIKWNLKRILKTFCYTKSWGQALNSVIFIHLWKGMACEFNDNAWWILRNCSLCYNFCDTSSRNCGLCFCGFIWTYQHMVNPERKIMNCFLCEFIWISVQVGYCIRNYELFLCAFTWIPVQGALTNNCYDNSYG
jgi:hypothetical protein